MVLVVIRGETSAGNNVSGLGNGLVYDWVEAVSGGCESDSLLTEDERRRFGRG